MDWTNIPKSRPFSIILCVDTKTQRTHQIFICFKFCSLSSITCFISRFSSTHCALEIRTHTHTHGAHPYEYWKVFALKIDLFKSENRLNATNFVFDVINCGPTIFGEMFRPAVPGGLIKNSLQIGYWCYRYACISSSNIYFRLHLVPRSRATVCFYTVHEWALLFSRHTNASACARQSWKFSIFDGLTSSPFACVFSIGTENASALFLWTAFAFRLRFYLFSIVSLFLARRNFEFTVQFWNEPYSRHCTYASYVWRFGGSCLLCIVSVLNLNSTFSTNRRDDATCITRLIHLMVYKLATAIVRT